MKLGIVLSNDWEIYGNGQGDFFSLQYEPTRQLLDVCERHGAKLTLMAEVGQQRAHEALAERESWAEEIASAWRGQAVHVVERGHDVQLHLHPQWIGAKHDGRDWNLDYNRYTLTSFPEGERVEILTRERHYLETLLKPIRPEYRCEAFRAGNFMVEPSDEYAKSLMEAGIICDSTVCKNQYLATELGSYDFRTAFSHYRPWWVAADSLNSASRCRTALLEIPILTESYGESPLLRKLLGLTSSKMGIPGERSASFRTAKSELGLDESDIERQSFNRRERQRRYLRRASPLGRVHSSNLRRAAHAAYRRTSLVLDYDALIPKVAAAMIINLHRKLANGGFDGYLPVVAIGHVKNMIDTEYVDEFLTLIDKSLGEEIIYVTMSDAYRGWLEGISSPQGQPLLTG